MQSDLFESQQDPSEIWSIGQLTREIRSTLENRFPPLWIKGEISNLRTQPSGHRYFVLKDSVSQINAVLFKGDFSHFGYIPKNGDECVAYGNVTVYEPRGDYQFRVKHILQEGTGNLQLQFDRLKAKLLAEGLFNEENRKTLPNLPRKIAVITSVRGAALQDFLSILKRRGWRGEISIFGSSVQGKEAPKELRDALTRAAKHGDADLIVLTRGGGSIEDLWSFNDESLVRLVADFPVPVISAIGHQTDFVLTDFAADFRAETPSAAAELISSLFINEVQTLDGLALAFKQSNLTLLEKLSEEIKILALELKVLSPRSKIDHAHQTLDELKERLQISSSHILRNHKELLSFLSKRIEGSNLKNILKKGFSYVKDGDGNVISDAGKLSRKQVVSVFFRDGKQVMKTQ